MKSSGPKVKSADIHLIIEYDKNESLGENLKSTRANRFIVHADQYNPVLAAHDSFKMLFDDADKPDILVVGGLQMMEGKLFNELLRLLKKKANLSDLKWEQEHALELINCQKVKDSIREK